MSIAGQHQLQVPRPVGADEFRGSSRYELLVKIASGGSASVYVGRVNGSAGFSRLVAVKRAHPHLAHDPAVQKMMRTEARLASGLNHANVVAVQDVEQVGAELLLILDYVEGASLSELISAGMHAGKPLPPRVALRVALDACAGLAAVHEIEGRDGRPVGFLHRDVSPQNILVGIDGTARITDFGLAKHICSDASKASGTLQGKLAYLAPEIIDKVTFSVQSDLFAMAVVLWEAMARRRLFQGDTWADTVRKVGLVQPPPLSRMVPGLDPRVDQAVARALAKEPTRRHPTVRAFLQELEAVGVEQNLIATTSEVAAHVLSVVGDELRRRRALIRPFQPIEDDDLMTTQTFQNIPAAAAAAAVVAAAAVPARGGPSRTAPPPAPAPGRFSPPPARHAPQPPARTSPPPAPARNAPHPPPVRTSPPPPPARNASPAAPLRTSPPPPPARNAPRPQPTRTAPPPPPVPRLTPTPAPGAVETLASPLFSAHAPPVGRRGGSLPTLVDDEESTVNRGPAPAPVPAQTPAPRSQTLRTPLDLSSAPSPEDTSPVPFIARPLPPEPPPPPAPAFIPRTPPAPVEPLPAGRRTASEPARARPQLASPLAFVSSGSLLGQSHRGAASRDEDLDDEDMKQTEVLRGHGAAEWNAPVREARQVPVDPISPWVPPTLAPPSPSKPARGAGKPLFAGVVTLAIGLGLGVAALQGQIKVSGLNLPWQRPAQSAPAAQTAAAAQPAAAPALTVAPAATPKATPAAAPVKGAQAKGAQAKGAQAKGAQVKGAQVKGAQALTPDALPDAEPGSSKTSAPAGRRPGETLTPDALPDAKPRQR